MLSYLDVHIVMRERYYEARIARWICSCGWSTDWVEVDTRAHEAVSALVFVHLKLR